MGLNIDELSTMDATAQAELVRRRELSPLELVDAAIARIERVNQSTVHQCLVPCQLFLPDGVDPLGV